MNITIKETKLTTMDKNNRKDGYRHGTQRIVSDLSDDNKRRGELDFHAAAQAGC